MVREHFGRVEEAYAVRVTFGAACLHARQGSTPGAIVDCGAYDALPLLLRTCPVSRVWVCGPFSRSVLVPFERKVVVSALPVGVDCGSHALYVVVLRLVLRLKSSWLALAERLDVPVDGMHVPRAIWADAAESCFGDTYVLRLVVEELLPVPVDASCVAQVPVRLSVTSVPLFAAVVESPFEPPWPTVLLREARQRYVVAGWVRSFVHELRFFALEIPFDFVEASCLCQKGRRSEKGHEHEHLKGEEDHPHHRGSKFQKGAKCGTDVYTGVDRKVE